MKKSFLLLIALVGFAFTSSAQCGEQATQLTNDCGSFCVSVSIPLTGNLAVDSANLTATGGTMMRKPSLRELLTVSEEIC